MRVLLVLLLSVAAASAASTRIIGGANADIRQYPFAAALIFSRTGSGTFYQSCGGTIISNRVIISAAHCFFGHAVAQWRARVGSARASTGGRVYNFNRITIHPSFNIFTYEGDIAVLGTSTNMATGTNVQPAQIAGVNYSVLDNAPVWTIGWGLVNWGGQYSDQLRHVQIWTINQNTCRQRYAGSGRNVTDNMVCAGWIDVGGRGACTGDNGGPLLHNNILFGVNSWAYQCASPRYPDVYTRVPRFTNWILQNA